MKKLIIFFIGFFTAKAFGQNEFAAQAFYSEFRKIYEDAQAGFINNKGNKRTSAYEELETDYNVKLLLPLADSGKIVFPVSGNRPYVVYFFEPEKMRLKVDQRAVHLRDAVLSVYDQPLYARSETSLVNNHPITNTWYFTDPAETRPALALFRMNIYFNEGKYNLAFEIRGQRN